MLTSSIQKTQNRNYQFQATFDAPRVAKRDGQLVDFDLDKIECAIACAFNDIGSKPNGDLPSLLDMVAHKVEYRSRDAGGVIGVEAIQDIVEDSLMRSGRTDVAKQYILYRAKHEKMRGAIDASPEDIEAIKRSRSYFGTELQMFQALNKYAKFLEDKGRREHWEETCDRVMGFIKEHLHKYDHDKGIEVSQWSMLRQSMLALEAFPSMRMMQMAGPAAMRENLCIFNCAYVQTDAISKFVETLYILMQGTGEGFSVESDFVEDLPKVKKQKKMDEVPICVVEDSTEGWCEALRLGMEAWFGGLDINFDYSLIRPAGTLLKTKGGTSSGPDPLRELLSFTKDIILFRQRKRLRTIDAHDLQCKIGKIVQVGGVRRAAMLSLSDLDDELMRNAKHGAFWSHSPHRNMANNSAVYEESPTDYQFMVEWLQLAKSGTGERGIFNRAGCYKHIPKRRKKRAFGINPCGEVLLRDRGLCNLSIVVCRPTDTVESLRRKVMIATIFGTIQSTMTHFNYVSDEWRKNAEEERLLGVDLCGALDCPLLAPMAEGRDELLRELRGLVIETNIEWAERLGINPSVATTVIKPGGNSSVLFKTGNSIYGWLHKYTKRNVRVNAVDPMAQFLIDAGVPHAPDYDELDAANPRVWVFSFPMEAPEGAVIASELSAIEQLEIWKSYKINWTEHNPSATIMLGENEWIPAQGWIKDNWDIIGGLAFQPRNNKVFPLAPNEPMTEEAFREFEASFPKIPWEKLPRYEHEDTRSLALDYACVGGACEFV